MDTHIYTGNVYTWLSVVKEEVTDTLPKTETWQIQRPAQRLAQAPMNMAGKLFILLVTMDNAGTVESP